MNIHLEPLSGPQTRAHLAQTPTGGSDGISFNTKGETPILRGVILASNAELTQSPDNIPDGGKMAWCTVAGGWLALFATFGYSSSFGVFQAYYTAVGTSTPSNISWIGSTGFFFFILTGLPAGKLVDMGYFKPTVAAGTLLYIFSMFMLSLSHPDRYYQLFLSQGVGMGVGMGLIYGPSLAVQAQYWRVRRAMAMGIVITGSSVGGIVYPPMLNHLFNNSVGFAWGVRASAFLTMGLLIAANFLMHTRLPGPKQRTGPTIPMREVLKDTPYMFEVAGVFFVMLGMFFPFYYMQVFTTFKGLSTNLAFYQLTIQSAASVFGRTLPNILADKFGAVNVMILASFGTGILIFAMFGITNAAGVIIFSIIYGFFSGAVLSLLIPVVASFSRSVGEVGTWMGVGYLLLSTAFLSGTPISGALLGAEYHWFRPIVFNGTVVLAGVPFMIKARAMQAERKHTKRV